MGLLSQSHLEPLTTNHHLRMPPTCRELHKQLERDNLVLPREHRCRRVLTCAYGGGESFDESFRKLSAGGHHNRSVWINGAVLLYRRTREKEYEHRHPYRQLHITT